MLGRDHGPLDDQQVEPRLEGDLVVLGDPLGGERSGGDHALRLDVLDLLRDQLGLQRLAIDLLHRRRGGRRRGRGHAPQLLLSVLVTGPDPL